MHQKCATESYERVCKNPNQIYCWEHSNLKSRTGRPSKTSKEKIAEMKTLRGEGWSLPKIGRKFNLNHTSILYFVGKGTGKSKKANPSPLIFKARGKHDQFGRPLGRSYTELFENQYGKKPKKDFYD